MVNVKNQPKRDDKIMILYYNSRLTIWIIHVYSIISLRPSDTYVRH